MIFYFKELSGTYSFEALYTVHFSLEIHYLIFWTVAICPRHNDNLYDIRKRIAKDKERYSVPQLVLYVKVRQQHVVVSK
jgi:hypothetical protein